MRRSFVKTAALVLSLGMMLIMLTACGSEKAGVAAVEEIADSPFYTATEPVEIVLELLGFVDLNRTETVTADGEAYLVFVGDTCVESPLVIAEEHIKVGPARLEQDMRAFLWNFQRHEERLSIQ